MSEIFLDTETTGLSFRDGHRIVEIACIETKDLIPTNKIFHKLINPKRDVPEEAFKIHGFSGEFLKDKETFDQIADELLDFVDNFKLNLIYSPAWTTDWMSEKTKEKLNKYGIAPPSNTVNCPQCNSDNVQLISEFGSTACKAMYKCSKCLEPFDFFKCI